MKVTLPRKVCYYCICLCPGISVVIPLGLMSLRSAEGKVLEGHTPTSLL